MDNKEKALINVGFIQTCLRMGMTIEQAKAIIEQNKEQK